VKDDFYSSPEWLDLRYRVLQKNNGSCRLCGCRATAENPIHVDHIKPRSLHPELALAESNLQILCKACNLGKSNKDSTDWRFQASNELIGQLNWKSAVLAHATPEQRAKLEQLSWLMRNDPDWGREAGRQYKVLWGEIEFDWTGTRVRE
jgi:5-methylcytosine-specific restriction endonuclease McrA